MSSGAASMPLPSGAALLTDPRSGTVRSLRGSNLSQLLESDDRFTSLQRLGSHVAIAVEFIARYRGLFRLVDPAAELMPVRTETDTLGLTRIRLQQRYHGIPIWGREMSVHLDRNNRVYLVQGRYVPTPRTVDGVFAISGDAAVERALQALGRTRSECSRCESERTIYVTAEQKTRAAFLVRAPLSLHEGWLVVVDAETGAVLERASTVADTGRS